MQTTSGRRRFAASPRSAPFASQKAISSAARSSSIRPRTASTETVCPSPAMRRCYPAAEGAPAASAGAPIGSDSTLKTREMEMRRMTVGVVVAATALLFAAGALAATFKGKASSDAQTKISFKVSGNTKDGKFINGKVSQIYVSNQKFTCYTKSGGAVYSGRISYLYNGSAPVKIKPNGSFRSEYKIVGSSHV